MSSSSPECFLIAARSVAVELDFLLQCGGLGVGVTGLGKILGDGGVGAHESGHRLVERNPQRLGRQRGRWDCWRRRRNSGGYCSISRGGGTGSHR